MDFSRLASAINRGTFLMEPRFAMGYMPTVYRFLAGEKVSFFGDDQEAKSPLQATYCISPEGQVVPSAYSDNGNVYQSAPVGSIMIIEIMNVIMQDDYCGPGTSTMANWVKEAAYSDNIAAIVFKIRSGGGQVSGTGELAATIKWADSIKPMVAFTDGILASAAYWIASACRRIFASFATVEVGSVGTAIKLMDNRKALEEYGYTEHYINSDGSPDKNGDYYEAIDGNYGPIKIHILNPTNDVFLKAVRENRKGVLVESQTKKGDQTIIEPLSGRVYLAETARDVHGLIDEIADFDNVLQYAADQATPQSSKSQKTNNMLNFGKFSKLSALATKAAGTITAEDVEGINEQIAAANVPDVTLMLDSELQALQDKAAKAEGSVAAADHKIATDKVTELEAALKVANDAKAAAEQKAAEFGAKPAAEATTGKKEGDDSISNTSAAEDEFFSEADAEFAAKMSSRTQLPK